MAAVTPSEVAGAKDTRERLIEAAVSLFAYHSFAGTSLQMIADRLGITKAAVYHHFHTRDELLTAVVEPALDQLRVVLDRAEAQRTPHARAHHMIAGYVELAVEHRRLMGLLGSDPAVAETLRAHEGFADLIARQVNLLVAAHPGVAGRVAANVALAGIASAAAAPLLADIDDETLREQLIEAACRVLGLRRPRASAH